MLRDLIIDKNSNFISWKSDNKSINVNQVLIESAIIIEDLNVILAIDKKVPDNYTLVLFSSIGDKVLEVMSPKGFIFSYVTYHPSIGPTVVCYEDKGKGWDDWYFSIDMSTGELKKVGKAY
ncbi:MAG: hypothetical protein ACQEWV_10455 [Bacillota bacterium]